MWGKKDFFGEEEATTGGVFASLYLEGTRLLIQLKTSRSAQRTEVPETGPCISLPFEILAKTFLADCRSAHEEASSGSVLDITGCLPGLSSSRGLSLLVGPMSPLGEGCALFPPHCQRVEVEQTRSLRGKRKTNWMDL